MWLLFYVFVDFRAVEIPAHFFYIYTMGKFGRRITLCGGLLICGFSCLAAGLVPQGKIINISSLESVCKEILIESLDEIKLADITAFIIESESYGFQQPYKRRVLLSAC